MSGWGGMSSTNFTTSNKLFLQLIYNCCGFRNYKDWYRIKWIMVSINHNFPTSLFIPKNQKRNELYKNHGAKRMVPLR